MSIAENLARTRERIALACKRAGRDPEGITLVAVSKTVGPEQVAEAIRAGVADLGENWVQEAAAKRPAVESVCPTRVRWHMIGHLQTNKVKKALEVFDRFQAIDSLRLAEELNRRAGMAGRTGLPVLVEVNTSAEESKFGVKPGEVRPLVEALLKLDRVVLEGLMTIGPGLSVEDPERSRPCFRLLRELRGGLEAEFGIALPVLSMGMSSDFAQAIEEGATVLRIGTAVFGARQYR